MVPSVGDHELARQTALGYHPDAVEVGGPAPPMHLLDGVVSEDWRSCVDIMHDAETNTFALVEERQDPGIIEAAEPETRRADLVQQVEPRAAMALGACKAVDEAVACRAALASTADTPARLRVEELGGDVGGAAAKLDGLPLTSSAGRSGAHRPDASRMLEDRFQRADIAHAGASGRRLAGPALPGAASAPAASPCSVRLPVDGAQRARLRPDGPAAHLQDARPFSRGRYTMGEIRSAYGSERFGRRDEEEQRALRGRA